MPIEKNEKVYIDLCPNHSDYYPTPLIWTFKFPGAEFWCPYCGYTCGIFGRTTEVLNITELQQRLDTYKKAAAEFLSTDSKKWNYNREAEKLEVNTTT